MYEDTAATGPVPFTADDFAARRARAAEVGREAGLAGLLMTPGPDLMYLTGYAPVAITERITMLVIPVTGEATMIVPKLERPDAENAVGAAGLQLVDWADGSDPTRPRGGCWREPEGTRSRTPRGRCTCWDSRSSFPSPRTCH